MNKDARQRSDKAIALRAAARNFWIDVTLEEGAGDGPALYRGHRVRTFDDAAGLARWAALARAADGFARTSQLRAACKQALEFLTGGGGIKVREAAAQACLDALKESK